MKLKFSALFLSLLFLNTSFSKTRDLRYLTSFGRCPKKIAGALTLRLVSLFEKERSLLALKTLLERDKLQDDHFVSSYQIDYDPLKETLSVNLDCPEPRLKVQIYKGKGLDSYEAILVDGGKLYELNYEKQLVKESKLKRRLPILAIPFKSWSEEVSKEMVSLVKKLPEDLSANISEIIITKENEMTALLSLSGKTLSAFLGKEKWPERFQKLKRIIDYTSQEKKTPSAVNFTENDKVVVKFRDNS